MDPHEEIAALRARIAEIERRAAGPSQPPGGGLAEAVERHYVDPPMAEVERRRHRADEAKAYGFAISESMEQTLGIERDHPAVFAGLPFAIRHTAAIYADQKAAAERVNARKEEAE